MGGMEESPRVGIGLRRAHFAELEACTRPIDFVEIQPETFLGRGGRAARALAVARERGEVLVHSVSLSLGGPDPLDDARLGALSTLLREQDARYLSDHICLSAIDGQETFDLLPLPFTTEAAAYLGARAREVRARLELPLVLENITYYELAPGSELTEGAFVSEVLERAGAGLLLDVSNVVVNARNQRVSAADLLDALPLERTVEIHLAGHRFDPRWGLVIDDHASAVSDESLALYERALRRIGRPVPTLVEWDQSIPPLGVLIDEADRVRARATRVFGTRPTASVPAGGP